MKSNAGERLSMKKALIGAASLLTAGLAGCDNGSGSDRDATAMYAWAKEVRAKCDVVGYGIDFGHAGWWYKTDVLKCPDGSINVIPVGVFN